MSRYLLLACIIFTFLVVVPAPALESRTKDFIPAGTILHCTMDEPNFSAKTANVGDPVLCHLGPLGSFGHSILPSGSRARRPSSGLQSSRPLLRQGMDGNSI